MKKISAYIGIIAVIVAVVALVFTQSKSSGSEGDYVVKIANLPITEGLPVYMAIEKGYFRDAGVSVELVRFDAPNQIIDAVLSGRVDMVSPSGAMGISAVADSKNPGKIKIYAASGGSVQAPLNGLFVGNATGIKIIEELKGKKIGVLPGIQWRTIATEMLAQHNVLVTDVTLVELAPGLHVTALESGQIDAVLTLEPNPTIIRSKNIGKEITPTPTTKIADPFFAGAGIINTEFMAKHPELSKKTLDVLEKAIVEIQKDPEGARKYLKGYTALTDDLIGKVNMPVIKSWNQISTSDITAIQSFYHIFFKHKVVDKELDFSSLLYK